MNGEFIKELLSHTVKDPEECSEKLMSHFGSAEAIFVADIHEISEVLSDDIKTAIYLKLCVALASRRVSDAFISGRRYGEDEIKEFLKAYFFGVSVETVVAVTFDRAGKFIALDKLSEGTVNFSSVLPRKILEVAKRRGAASVAVAHNHPGGFATPSCDDIESSKMLTEMLRISGIDVYGHYVVAGSDCKKTE